MVHAVVLLSVNGESSIVNRVLELIHDSRLTIDGSPFTIHHSPFSS